MQNSILMKTTTASPKNRRNLIRNPGKPVYTKIVKVRLKIVVSTLTQEPLIITPNLSRMLSYHRPLAQKKAKADSNRL